MVRYDKFFGGISQDDRIQSVGEFTYGKNINIRKGKWVELSKKVELVSTTDSAITAHISTPLGDDYYSTYDGKIYKSSDGGATFTLKYTGTYPVLDMRVLTSDLVWWDVANGTMYIQEDYATEPTWSPTTTAFPASINAQSVLVGRDLIFFIADKKVGEILSSAPTDVVYYGSTFTLPFQTYLDVAGLSLHGNSLWVYDREGKMYAMDNQSEEVVGFKDFKEDIIAIKNMGGYDIVITSSGGSENSRSFYINTGVSPESSTLLRRYVYSDVCANSTTGGGYRFGFNKVSVNADNCFADSEGVIYWVSNELGNNVIYSFGKNNNVLPESFSIVSDKDEAGDNWGTINAIWAKDGNLYVSQTKSGSHYLKKIDLVDSGTGIHPSTGFLVTKVDDFGQYEIPKIIKQVMVGADIPSGTYIQLDYSINEGEFTTYQTITNADQIGTNGKKFEFSTPTEMFNEICWRITLSTTSESTTPRLYSFSYEVETEIYQKTN